MKNDFGCDVNSLTRPSDTLSKSTREIAQVILCMWCGFGEGLARGVFCTTLAPYASSSVKNGLESDVNGTGLCFW